tara:strand:- start:62 stop:394 length:333 start_codon:yes stop_codon:yes gene_type:complete
MNNREKKNLEEKKDVEENKNENENLNKLIQHLIKKNEILEEKLDRVLSILNNEVVENTTKMSDHIDLIENIYNNVKSPLGYLCNKINYLKGTDKTEYTIENKTSDKMYIH